MTCGQLIDYIMEKYYVKVFIICSGDSTIINLDMPSHEKRINQKIEDIYNAYSKVKLSENIKELYLEISGDIGDVTALMPTFKYIFKK